MKRFTLPALMVAAFVILLSSCQSNSKENTTQQKTAAFNLDSAKKSIDEQNAAFQKAFENSDSVGLANLFTSDGKMMMPGAPSIVGRPAITSTVAMFMKMNIKRQAKTIDVWGNGDLLAEEGNAKLFDQKGGEIEHAKYLVIWKKEDGQWKLFRDMWNTDLTPKSSK
jgi:uncharacterized protein (TIGR02246 family)